MTETWIRGSVFMSLIGLLTIAEMRWPRNRGPANRRHRWPVNLALGATNVLAVSLLMPWIAIDAARWTAIHEVGLSYALGIPPTAGAVLTFVLLDLVLYSQHVATHRIDALWRLHRLHHSDLALDVSTAVRFHPLEILLSMAVKIGAILALGASPATVIVFEAALNGFALFTHANIALPEVVGGLIRPIWITPDLHKIHHSVLQAEHDRNFGFQLSVWDRLFGTYLAEASRPAETIRIGLPEFRSSADQRLQALLAQPFH